MTVDTINNELEFLNKNVFKNKKYKLKYMKEERNYFLIIKRGKKELIYKFSSPRDVMNMVEIMKYIFNKDNN